ncbi:DUF3077 domain-containing protein [Stutzerimonas kunmingensis]|uniref:DUF3077 domain-containing protein n=1 Tax=Stutzerimonas kunmingensis TaxID=1211807 RepID=UPI0028AADEC5|nr:DUF3077 domain-containing protein [Stutzerimonas kunmingensis]
MRPTKTTEGFTFHRTASITPDHLFAVASDVAAVDALYGVSDLLAMVDDALLAAVLDDTPLQSNTAKMAHYALESARAVLDAVIDGMERERPRRSGTRQQRHRTSTPEA